MLADSRFSISSDTLVNMLAWPISTVSDTISLGSGLLAILIVAVTAFMYARTKGAGVWQNEAAAHQARADRVSGELEVTKKELERSHDRVDQLTQTIETVGGAKVFDAVKASEASSAERVSEAMGVITRLFESHERRAEERHRALLGVIETVGNELATLAREMNALADQTKRKP